MTKNIKHIEDQPELNRDLQEMISGSRIAWGKTKEDIWTEMLEKIEAKSYTTKNTKIIYLQLRKLAVAAVFLILLSIPAIIFFYTKTIENSLELRAEVFLPDNSRVLVNAQSVLSYKPLLWKFTRTVKLEGEALFEVKKGKKFEVVSIKGKTVVLGTQFIVYSRNNDYNVTCVSGKVKVIEAAYQNEAILIAGKKAILKPDGKFEIQDVIVSQPEISNKSKNQIIEEELNDVLLPTTTHSQPVSKEQNWESTNKQTNVKEQAKKEEQGETDVSNAIKEQINSQNKTIEEAQSKEQSKASTQAQVGNKEQGSAQKQEKVEDQNTSNRQNKDKFRTSLTPEQISILENKQMSKEEKRKAFLESLSPEQRQMLKEQTEENIKQGEGKDNELKERQKTQMREQLRDDNAKENQQQQMQQNRENMENAKPDGGNGAGSDNESKPDNGPGGQSGNGN